MGLRLAWAHELVLLGSCLEASVTELGGGIDELELDLLEGLAAGVGEETLAKGDDALLGADNAALHHEEVFVDLTVVGESAEWCDALLGKVLLGHARLVVALGSDHVHLLVELSAVVVPILTGAWDSERHTAWVP